jgi:hypothetical protein
LLDARLRVTEAFLGKEPSARFFLARLVDKFEDWPNVRFRKNLASPRFFSSKIPPVVVGTRWHAS